jgi:hypothetical protein
MATTSIIDIKVLSESFTAFQKQFDQYTTKLAATPDQRQAAGAAAREGAREEVLLQFFRRGP